MENHDNRASRTKSTVNLRLTKCILQNEQIPGDLLGESTIKLYQKVLDQNKIKAD